MLLAYFFLLLWVFESLTTIIKFKPIRKKGVLRIYCPMIFSCSNLNVKYDLMSIKKNVLENKLFLRHSIPIIKLDIKISHVPFLIHIDLNKPSTFSHHLFYITDLYINKGEEHKFQNNFFFSILKPKLICI